MIKGNFYFSWFSFAISLYLLVLSKDVFIGIYLYVHYDVFYIDFAFKKAFLAVLAIVIPCFFISWLHYKYGKDSDYQKQKYLKEKVTYKVINERYKEKKRK
ncbi:hypothetical protein GVX86_06705 [[Haemophilus] felis]|nr:hypothetical protein [[Haemophilus] felis]